MWYMLKSINLSEKLFFNKNKSLDIEINDTNEQIFNFLNRIGYFCVYFKKLPLYTDNLDLID